MSDNTLIPNTYQKPNVYSDLYDYYLSPEESKVLDFIIRRILGFEEHRATRRDRISLSQVCEGIQRADGAWITRGTGLSRPTASKCIKSLARFRFIAEVGEATQDGQEYELNTGQLGDIRLDLLEQRKADEQAREAKRGQAIKAAKQMRFTSKSDLPPAAGSKCDLPQVVNGINQGSKCDLPQVVNGIYTQNPLQNPPSKPTRNPGGKAASAAPPPPSKPTRSGSVTASPKKSSRAVHETPEETAYYAACVPVVARVCRIDLKVTGEWARCKKPLQALYHATVRPTPDLLAFHYETPTGYWYTRDFRGQKGETPEPHWIQNTWGKAVSAAPRVIQGGNGNPPRAAPVSRTERNRQLLEEAMREELGQSAPNTGPVIEGRVIHGFAS